mmetsp:Transcript_14182/g.20255  ORF Transcript_14182/g.20255 Transcript_14182/m.20255 type:complete len:101 (+) Transcript_14182:67-369(+)
MAYPSHSTESPRRKSVSFADVRIREYEVVPDAQSKKADSNGPKLSLGWAYNVRDPIEVEEFENSRLGHKRGKEMMLIPSVMREQMLLEFGFSRSQINGKK